MQRVPDLHMKTWQKRSRPRGRPETKRNPAYYRSRPRQVGPSFHQDAQAFTNTGASICPPDLSLEWNIATHKTTTDNIPRC
jgi:hypothetical protein